MPLVEETVAAMRREMRPLLEAAMEGVLTKTRSVLEEVEQQRIKGFDDVNAERARGLADVAAERAKALAEVDARGAELHQEIVAMQTHQEKQQGRVELNIGGYRFQTSVQTLRRVPHTFFDAYFSGRYAQDVCNDGSIFVDRDGGHFGHVLEYLRDGVVSVAEPGARPRVSLLRALKREFGYYCIELYAERPLRRPEMAYVMGGNDFERNVLSSMERYDAASGEWSAMTAMTKARTKASACSIAGMVYVTGGVWYDDGDLCVLRSVERYSPASDTWRFVARMPRARYNHAAVAVGSAMYVLGGNDSAGAAIKRSFKYDSTQNVWSEVAPMPEDCKALAACAVENDIYVFGGIEDKFMFRYDTTADAWSILAPMPLQCKNHSASVVNGFIYIVGADDNGHRVLRFDPVSHTWSFPADTSNNVRLGASFVVSGRLYALIGVGSVSRTEIYDMIADTWAMVAGMLERRKNFCAVAVGHADPAEEQDLFDSLITRKSQKRPRLL
jgi:hypothetical protein